MKRTYIYLIIVLGLYAAFTLVFTTFPRSTFSELEKRELATFPKLTLEDLSQGKFTSNVSRWFSDSEPFRDKFMALSMLFSDRTKLRMFKSGEEQIKFHAADSKTAANPDEMPQTADPKDIKDYTNNVTADANAKVANHGIIIVGEGNNVRALMAYGGGPEGGSMYAKACNEYYKAFGPSGVKVYCMLVPTAGEFYTPNAAREATKSELPTIKAIHDRLDDSVIVVNAYSALAAHVKENIYLRTDHHWAPLGAYYAAQAFAKAAGVPFRDLSAANYEKKVIHGYVGSMYGYSRDISVKEAPEDFVFWVPKGVTYTTSYISYKTNKSYQVVAERPKVMGNFFYDYPDGSGGAYCTFMGGDTKITHINTSTKNGRRMLIIKDSFGNPIPSFLFYSFEDIHVVDYRYFTKNMKKYVQDNKITDIVLFAEIFRAYAKGGELIDYLTQPDGTIKGEPDDDDKPQGKKKR